MIQIAIMGLGTVGTGVAKVVEENREQIQRKLGEELEVKRVLVRHFREGPFRHLMTDQIEEICWGYTRMPLARSPHCAAGRCRRGNREHSSSASKRFP